MESNRFWWFLMSTLSVVNDSSHSYLTTQKCIRKRELNAIWSFSFSNYLQRRKECTNLWGHPWQIFWSAKDPPSTLLSMAGWPRAFKASSRLSTKELKNSSASCCSRKFTGSPHNLEWSEDNKTFASTKQAICIFNQNYFWVFHTWTVSRIPLGRSTAVWMQPDVQKWPVGDVIHQCCIPSCPLTCWKVYHQTDGGSWTPHHEDPHYSVETEQTDET